MSRQKFLFLCPSTIGLLQSEEDETDRYDRASFSRGFDFRMETVRNSVDFSADYRRKFPRFPSITALRIQVDEKIPSLREKS